MSSGGESARGGLGCLRRVDASIFNRRRLLLQCRGGWL